MRWLLSDTCGLKVQLELASANLAAVCCACLACTCFFGSGGGGGGGECINSQVCQAIVITFSEKFAILMLFMNELIYLKCTCMYIILVQEPHLQTHTITSCKSDGSYTDACTCACA